MNEIMKRALIDCLFHWELMYEWVEKRRKKGFADYNKMEKELGEEWGASDCSLCMLYKREDDTCTYCPFILVVGYKCIVLGWAKINCSLTWEEWLYHTGDFIGVMQQLYAELFILKGR